MGTMEYGHHVPECSMLTLFEFVRSFMSETKGKLASGLNQILEHELNLKEYIRVFLGLKCKVRSRVHLFFEILV